VSLKVTSMHIELVALFGRFVWRGVNIDDVTIPILPEVRGSIPHWRCANTTGSHTLQHPKRKTWTFWKSTLKASKV